MLLKQTNTSVVRAVFTYVESNLRLPGFELLRLVIGLTKLAPPSEPIKTNVTCLCKFSLALCGLHLLGVLIGQMDCFALFVIGQGYYFGLILRYSIK